MSSEDPRAPRPRPGRFVLTAGATVAVLVVLGFIFWALQASWRLGGETPMPIHGWIAVGIAFVFTGVLGGGLMWLAFYSARKGYDDDVGKDD